MKEQEFEVEVRGKKGSALRALQDPKDPPTPPSVSHQHQDEAEGVETEDDPSLSSLARSPDVF